jgi:hypothetical protein
MNSLRPEENHMSTSTDNDKNLYSASQPQVIETENYIFRIHSEDYLEYEVKENAVIDAQEVLEGKRLVTKARPNCKFFVLARGVKFFTLTKEAREILATKAFADNQHAVVFYTPNPTLLLVGQMYMKINKPHVPTKIVNNLEAAKKWLHEKRKIFSKKI